MIVLLLGLLLPSRTTTNRAVLPTLQLLPAKTLPAVLPTLQLLRATKLPAVLPTLQQAAKLRLILSAAKTEPLSCKQVNLV